MKQMMEKMKQDHDNFQVGRIMIVDDEAELMKALCEALTGQGYAANGFATGADALKVLAQQEYDLLLTDLMMPEMDGIALLHAGLEIDPNLVGIIMTGHGTVPTAVEAMKTGAFDYVLKPFKLNTLLPLLSRAMEVRSLRMENIQLRETVAIHELGKAIAFSSDLNAILNKVADATMQQCNADEVSVMLPTRDGKELYVAVSRGGHREYIGEHVPMERGIAGWVASHRETVVINGTADDPRFSPVHPRDDIRTAVSMPMMSGGNLVGVLNVNVTRSNRHMTLGQVKALSILVSIISPILENTWLNIQIRQAEEKYRSIFENATEGIYQTTPEGQFVTANAAMATMLGYDSPDELISTATDIAGQIYVNPEERTKLTEMIKECGQVKKFETRFYRKDGCIIWVSVNVRAVCDKKGEPLNYDAIAEDITERKKAEEKILHSNEELEKMVTERTRELQDSQLALLNVVDDLNVSAKNIALANQALDATNKELEAFSYSVSHDLRAPLRGMDGFSQALLEDYGDKLDATGKNYLKRIREGAQRMGWLIDDLLKLSRVSRSEFKIQTIDLSNMVRTIIAAQKQNDPERTVNIIIQDGVIIQGDRYILQIALTNLIDNSWKFTGKEEYPCIEFGSIMEEEKTVIFIRDNGAGFDSTYADKLFGTFQRLHTEAEFPGTGIGLATVQRVIHRHGGEIWAEGEVGKGAVFYFTVP